MVSDSHSEDQDRQENRPFIKETVITEEQKPSLGKKLLQTSLLALCFGVIAAFAFHIVHTRLDPSPEETTSAAEPISFPEDTDPGKAAYLLNDEITDEKIRNLHILSAVQER